MHDGYIFTLGICGSAGGLAQLCLDALLAALPPVKRAAFLGAVLLTDDAPGLADPLVEPIRADIADAELLLIVTPTSAGGGLPPRLRGLARAVEAAPPPARTRYALLVAVGERHEADLEPLRRLCAAARATVVSELWLPDEGEALSDGRLKQLKYLASAAYTRARALAPEALPHEYD